MELLNKFDKRKTIENKSGTKAGKMQGSKSAKIHANKSKIQGAKSKIQSSKS